jgi:hypothetical protein
MSRLSVIGRVLCVLILPTTLLRFESRLVLAQAPPAPSDDAARATVLIAGIPSAEKDLELDYENALLHRTLGKAYILKSVVNPSPHGNDLGLAFGEYTASLDLEANPDVEQELGTLYEMLPKELRKLPFKEFRATTATLYNVQKPNIMTVVNARRDLEAAAMACGVFAIAKPRGTAYEATRQHLHQMFLLATGREILRDRKVYRGRSSSGRSTSPGRTFALSGRFARRRVATSIARALSCWWWTTWVSSSTGPFRSFRSTNGRRS